MNTNDRVKDMISKIKDDANMTMRLIKHEIEFIPKPYTQESLDRIHELTDMYYQVEPWSY